MKRIHVVAGVLSDTQGRVLVAQRKAYGPLAEHWEFPGGKVEPGESAEIALARELHEELGVGIAGLEPLVRVPWDYPDIHVDLDVYRVGQYDGVPRGREDQPVQWVAMAALHALTMPPADRPVVAALRLPRRYLVTSEPRIDELDAFVALLGLRVREGARFVQLRAKALPEEPLRALAARCRDIARAGDATLLINGRVDLCLALALDGVHLPAAVARGMTQRPVPPACWLGVSCHDEAELAHAMALSADFVTLGPVLETASHPGARALGWIEFARLALACPLPCFAIGGVGPSESAIAREYGAFGIAGIRALWLGS